MDNGIIEVDNATKSMIGQLLKWGRILKEAEFVGVKMKIMKGWGKNWKEKEEKEIRFGEEGEEARLNSNSIIEPSIQKIVWTEIVEGIATNPTVVELFKLVKEWVN